MTKSSEKFEHFLHIREYDAKRFGVRAAAVLSVIKSANKWRIETNHRNKVANDVAEAHGDKRWLPENVDIRLTIKDFAERTFGFCGGRNATIEAIKLLESLGIISIYTNPNKAYTSDKGRYFRFDQDIYNQAMAKFKKQRAMAVPDEDSQDENEQTEEGLQDEGPFDGDNVPPVYDQTDVQGHGLGLNHAGFNSKPEGGEDTFKIKRPPFKNKPPIMNSNNNYKNKNQPINVPRVFVDHEKRFSLLENEKKEDVQLVIDVLLHLGTPPKRFNFPDVVPALKRLVDKGATVSLFVKAHELASTATQGNGFGIGYLVKVVEGLLAGAQKGPLCFNKRPPVPSEKTNRQNDETDLSNSMHWINLED